MPQKVELIHKTEARGNQTDKFCSGRCKRSSCAAKINEISRTVRKSTRTVRADFQQSKCERSRPEKNGRHSTAAQSLVRDFSHSGASAQPDETNNEHGRAKQPYRGGRYGYRRHFWQADPRTAHRGGQQIGSRDQEQDQNQYFFFYLFYLHSWMK